MKSKIEKLAQIESENLDCRSPTDYHEHFSAKSIDESKASVYFTPTDGHLSPQPPQMSPIHINYINEEGATGGCDFDGARGSGWKSSAVLRNVVRSHHNPIQRRSFQLPTDFLDEADEGNFIIPDQIYADLPKDDDFRDVLDDAPLNRLMDAESMSSLSSVPNESINRRRKKKKYREKETRKANYSVENEAFLLQDMMDASTGARRKVRHQDMPTTSSASSSQCSSRKESKGYKLRILPNIFKFY